MTDGKTRVVEYVKQNSHYFCYLQMHNLSRWPAAHVLRQISLSILNSHHIYILTVFIPEFSVVVDVIVDVNTNSAAVT